MEFARLNFDFHPRQVQEWCEQLGFKLERKLTVSHFRSDALKRLVPVGLLTALDALLQPTGGLWQLTPSVFYRLSGGNSVASATPADATRAAVVSLPRVWPLAPYGRLRKASLRRMWTPVGWCVMESTTSADPAGTPQV